MLELFDRLNTMATRLWNAEASTGAFPALNLRDEGDRFRAEAEIPGCRLEDLEVSMLGLELRIRGRRPSQLKEGWTAVRGETVTGEFFRGIVLPSEVDADGIEATLDQGVLSIVLPKAEGAKPRKVNVKALGWKK